MKKLALCIGINEYKVSPLRGCVNDCNNMKQLLEKVGYDVKQLLNSEATKDNIIKALSEMMGSLEDGDRMVLSVSGHGSYIPDINNTEEDGRTEIICTYDLINADGTWNFQNIITDDELFNILSSKPNVMVETFFDCCHSQGTSRSIQPNILQRYVECPTFRDIPTVPSNKRYNIIKENINIVEWSGCKSEQTSADAFINGNYQGAFTHFLFKNLGKSRIEMIENIQKDIKSAGFEQIPQLTCSDDKLNSLLFM